MKKVTLKLTALVMLLGGALSVANAQTTKINVVTSAVPFLRISPDARSGGMGDLGVASQRDRCVGTAYLGCQARSATANSS